MIEAEELIGVKLFFLKENSPGVLRTGGLTDPTFENVHHHSGKKQIVQLREYYGIGITLSTEEGIFMTGNEYLEGIPFDEEWAMRCGFQDKYSNGVLSIETIKGVFISYNIFNTVLYLSTQSESVALSTTKYLHQVMQLYYDLTGNVLKPKL